MAWRTRATPSDAARATSTVETVRLGDNAATYGVGPRKMTDGYAYIMPMRGYINLGFYQGAVLADPKRPLEGTGRGCVT